MRIFLVGMMGSGKSTVGKKLAESLLVDFHDLDKIIEAKLKKNIKDIFEEDGEGFFRDIENKSLIDYLKFFLQDSSIKFTDIDEYELDGDYIESQAFGYLSIRSFLNLPISFPHTTRCKSPTLGGKINKNF